MSTNYYYRKVGAVGYHEEHHIGLSAANHFMFRVYLQQGLFTFAAWQKKLQDPGLEIVSEYNEPVTFELFVERIANVNPLRAEYKNSPLLAAGTKPNSTIRRYRDEEGHLFGNYVFS